MKIEGMIDHTILRADAREEEVVQYCVDAKKHGFASVCVNTYNVPLVANELRGAEVKVCCVVGFPLGAMSTASKVFETKKAVEDGAQEVDMVINIGALKSKNYDVVEADIREIVEAAKPATVKVIIETCYLTDDEKKCACELSVKSGAAFVKTSTGFGTGGATPEDVALMRSVVGDKAYVKASGGIRSREDAMKMIEAGADRIGVGNGITLL